MSSSSQIILRTSFSQNINWDGEEETMQRNVLTWVVLGISGILIVNIINVISSLYFGTLHASPSFVLGSCIMFTIFVAIITHRLYRKAKNRLPISTRPLYDTLRRTFPRSPPPSRSRICPACNQNLLRPGQDVCDECGRKLMGR